MDYEWLRFFGGDDEAQWSTCIASTRITHHGVHLVQYIIHDCWLCSFCLLESSPDKTPLSFVNTSYVPFKFPYVTISITTCSIVESCLFTRLHNRMSLPVRSQYLWSVSQLTWPSWPSWPRTQKRHSGGLRRCSLWLNNRLSPSTIFKLSATKFSKTMINQL